jgi:[protein-PII] uridylyltransferase
LPVPPTQLEEYQTPGELAAYLRAERERLIGQILHSPSPHHPTITGLGMAQRFSDLMDAVVIRLYRLSCARVGVDPATLPVCIVATGGYGRRELSPFSDLDITFIPQRDGDARIDRLIREMFTQVMDICISRCGVEVGYAYRLLEDCVSLDHHTYCGLLDARLIVGSERLFIQFDDAYWAGMNTTDFIFTKLRERENGLLKWGRVPRVVEPQLKEGPGGLRDLHMIVWLMQARSQLSGARVRGARLSDALTKYADLTPEETHQLDAAREQVMRVRNALHAVSGAARDTLVITRQEAVAAALGYRADTGDPSPPIERFMGDLYPHLANVRRLAQQVMRQIGNSRLILGIGLDSKGGNIVPANNALESDDPIWLLWAFELAQKYTLEFSDGLERIAVALVGIVPVLSDHVAAGQIFSRILSSKGTLYPTLQRMADLGVLGWFIPEFAPLMDLIPYDPSHDFTVGQHTLHVIRNIEDLLLATDAHGEEQMEMRRLVEELPHPEQLMLAALLHDCGKTITGRPHSETGEELAEAVCKRFGWSTMATANVRFLVRHHLLMAETSRLRDLNLDETITDFIRVVDDVDRLNMLYLLTYADTKAVGAGTWTQVKGRFLHDLWARAMGQLCEEDSQDLDGAALAWARRRLMKDLTLPNVPADEVKEHIQAMPPQYLLNLPPSRIALHIDFVRQVRAGQPVVDFCDERNATYTLLTVATTDEPRPGLLAKIAVVLYAADLVVHSAQVMTRLTAADRIALDVLWVDYRGRQLTVGKRKEVAEGITRVLTGEQTVASLLARHRDRLGRLGAENIPGEMVVHVVSVRNDLASELTVIETGGLDEQGALYWPAAALALLHWDIRSARVSTWRGEARAVFYVADLRQLGEAEVRVHLETVFGELLSRRDGASGADLVSGETDPGEADS